MRTSGLLLCSLVACVAAAGHEKLEIIDRLRSKAKSPATRSVIDRFSSLIDQTSDQTPGDEAIAAILEAIKDLIDEIRDTVKPMIVQGFKDTVKAVSSAIEDLEGKADKCFKNKGKADDQEEAWDHCITDEVNALGKYRDAENKHQKASDEAERLCKLWDEARPFTGSVELEAWPCNIEDEQGDCSSSLGIYASTADDLVNQLKSQLSDHKGEHKDAKEACEKAIIDRDDKKKIKDDRSRDFYDQQADCKENKLVARDTAYCSFGESYQRKCSKVDNYEALVALIFGAGGNSVHTDIDRQLEWAAADAAQCMLQEIKDGAELVGSLYNECLAKVDYKNDVGEMDADNLQTDKFETLKNDGGLDCPKEEVQIQFFGVTWKLPKDTDGYPEVDDYKRITNPAHTLALTPRDNFDDCVSTR